MKKTPLANGTITAPPPSRIPQGDVQVDNPEPPAKNGAKEPEGVKPRLPDSGAPPGKRTLEQLHQDQDDRLDRLFSGEEDDPAPVPRKKEEPKEPAPVPPKKEPEPPKEPKESKESKEVTEGEEDLSFDKPPVGSSEAERETAAQKRAKENGQALEALRTEHQELKLELERTKMEAETLRTQGGQQQYRETDFLRHPEVDSLRQEIIRDRDAAAVTQSIPEAGRVITGKYGEYMEKFLSRQAEQDESAVQAIDAELRKSIGDDFRDAYRTANGDGFDEQEMDREARAFTKDVLQLLVRNSGKTQELQSRISTLASKAKEGMLAQGVEVYRFHETDLGTALDAIPSVSDEVISENPHTVEATVASLVKQPVWKKEYDKDRKIVLELLLGPRALSQKEIDDMNAAGVDVRDFGKKRQKSWLDRRRKLAVAITQALMIRRLWEQTSRDAASFADANGELDALSRAKPKDADPPVPPKEKKKASEFTSAIEEHLVEVEGRK